MSQVFFLNVSVSDLVLRFYTKSCHCLRGFFHSCITCSLLKFPAELVTEDVHNRHVDKSVDVVFFYLLLIGFYFTLFRSLCAEVCWQAVQSVCSHAYIHATGAVIK